MPSSGERRSRPICAAASLTVAVGESQAFGGVVKGTFGLAKSPAGADFKAQLQFTDVDLEQCLGELFGIRKLEGKGNLGFAIESSGDSVYELTKALNGTAGAHQPQGRDRRVQCRAIAQAHRAAAAVGRRRVPYRQDALRDA